MILSALLTSVGINLGLCLLFFTLYSILRKQPSNFGVYAPRLVAQHKNEERSRFNLDRLIPSPGWVKEAWQPSEEQLSSLSGFDAVVFMRIFTFSLKVFAFAGIVGLAVLLPINYTGTQLSDDATLSNKSLDSFSISNVDDGSNCCYGAGLSDKCHSSRSRLWVHFCAAYIFTGVVCYLLYYEYDYISSKRIAYFSSCKPSPSQFTVLVRGVRVSKGESVSENVGSFFSEMYPDTYLVNSVVHKTSQLQKLMNDADKLSKYLARLKLDGKSSSQRFTRDGLLGILGRRVNFIDYFDKKLGDLEEKIKEEETSLAGKEVPSSFVSFKTRIAAALTLHIQQRTNPTEWVTEEAPEPEDIHWPFFSSSFLQQWVSSVTVIGACVTITILFFIPVLLVQGLANLEQLETWFPFLSGILDLAVVTEVITGYLPSVILDQFLSLIPPTMLFLSSMQGFIALSQIQKSTCSKVLLFTIWNVFFANVLSGSALYRVTIFLQPREIPAVLAEAVPSQASFFISYVVTSGWTGISSELFQLVPLLRSFIVRLFCRKDDDDDDDDEVVVQPIPYHSIIPMIAFFGLLGITYFFLAPLILPFIFIFYCMGYIVYRNQIMNVYAFKYDTYGKFWPDMHNSMIFSLILMHVIAIGIFGLKTLPLASGLMVPLPILTILFNQYCSKRFVPMFKAFPAECLIKKDKEDQSEAAVDDFYSNLATAYGDPTLKRRPRSTRTPDSVISPLLLDAHT